MPDGDFVAANSRHMENVFRHAFLFELSRHLLLKEPPQKLIVLNSEVDDSGVDLVLTLGSITRHVQMKTLNKRHAPNPYNIAESLFAMPGGCVIWMCYDPVTVEPTGYHFLGQPGNGLMADANAFPIAKKKRNRVWVERKGYRDVKSSHANKKDLSLAALSLALFGEDREEDSL